MVACKCVRWPHWTPCWRTTGRSHSPPYIQRPLTDTERYQTIYGQREGSAAAPTAGLHFTPQLLDQLRAKQVQLAFVTLHIGPGHVPAHSH